MKIQSIQTFGQPTISDYYRFVREKFAEELNSYPADKLLGSDTEELTNYFLQKFSLSPLLIDDSRDIEIDKRVKTEKFRTILDSIATKEVSYARITIPLEPGLDLAVSFKYHTQTHVMKEYEFDFDESNFTVSVEALPESIQAAIEEHTTLFAQRTAEINQNTPELRIRIKDLIEQRKKKLQDDDASFEAMVQKVTIPLKRKPKLEDFHIPLSVREELKKLTVPLSNPPKELILTEEQLKSILEILDSDGRNFENTPETFSKLDEPDLRNILLTHLNHYFPDNATGETFSGLGKSDIRLKVFKGQILIVECKYWHGEKEFGEAINQLFFYLTWRHNYGIVIVFSRNQNFTEILEKIKSSIQTHSSYNGGFTEVNQTHFRSLHTFPDDSNKQVEIRSLIYNLYHIK